MRILLVSSYGLLGGAELSLTSFLDHRPPDADVDVLLVSDGPARPLFAERGLPIWVGHGYEGHPPLRKVGRFTRSLGRLLEERRPDVVWAMGQKAAGMSVAACRARGVPLVWHKVDFSWDHYAKPLALGVTDVVSVSHAAAAALGPFKDRRLLGTVGPPIRLGAPLPRRDDPAAPAIGTVARLVPYKGQDLMVRAGALLRDEFPTLRVVLAGGPVDQYPGYQEALEQLAVELGMADAVEIRGFVPSVPEVLAELSVFLTATYRDSDGFGWEGLSTAMLEASAAGCPLVAVRGGGTAEGLVDGVTGHLVEQPDPAAIAEACARWLRDPEAARRAGRAGRDWVQDRFSPEAAGAQLWSMLGRAAAADSGVLRAGGPRADNSDRDLLPVS